jgi:hypothetical protein
VLQWRQLQRSIVAVCRGKWRGTHNGTEDSCSNKTVAMETVGTTIDRSIVRCAVVKRRLTNPVRFLLLYLTVLYQVKIWVVLYQKSKSYKRNLYGALNKST